jgi:activator of HSP90 ATPase
MAKTIRQTVDFDAPPHDVFEALMDAKKHGAFTGDTATINRRVGGTFSVFGGYATGKTLRLEKDKVIVQAWRSTDFGKDDPDSKAMFHFSKKGDGTRLIFVQSDVPDAISDDIKQGWIDFYWNPLKDYLKSKKRIVRGNRRRE